MHEDFGTSTTAPYLKRVENPVNLARLYLKIAVNASAKNLGNCFVPNSNVAIANLQFRLYLILKNWKASVHGALHTVLTMWNVVFVYVPHQV